MVVELFGVWRIMLSGIVVEIVVFWFINENNIGEVIFGNGIVYCFWID